MKKDTLYFPHDYNARNDEKILCLRAKHGAAGYGAYWMIIEKMWETPNGILKHKFIEGLADANLPISKLQEVISCCVEYELFASNGEEFWSETVNRRRRERDARRSKQAEGGRRGMVSRYNSNLPITTSQDTGKVVVSNLQGTGKVVVSSDTKDKDKDKEEYTQEEREEYVVPTTKKRFKKPTIEEIRAYFAEKHANAAVAAFEAERFNDYYESNGWYVGKQPMKDWKAAVRNWLRNVKRSEPNAGSAAAGNTATSETDKPEIVYVPQQRYQQIQREIARGEYVPIPGKLVMPIPDRR